MIYLRFYFKICHFYIKKKIKERIKNFFGGDSPIETNFSQKLKECNALLAGGFVLSAINNEERSTADMDIYVKNKDAEKLLIFFMSITPPHQDILLVQVRQALLLLRSKIFLLYMINHF